MACVVMALAGFAMHVVAVMGRCCCGDERMVQVCGELAGMVQAVDDFRQFLGPELKAVTGDTSVIDEVSVMVQVRAGGGCAARWQAGGGRWAGTCVKDEATRRANDVG